MQLMVDEKEFEGLANSNNYYKKNDGLAWIVVGSAGLGKSSFINLFSKRKALVSQGSDSCTKAISYYKSKYKDSNNKEFILIDTVGYEDTDGLTNEQVSTDILRFINTQNITSVILFWLIKPDVRASKTLQDQAEFIDSFCSKNNNIWKSCVIIVKEQSPIQAINKSVGALDSIQKILMRNNGNNNNDNNNNNNSIKNLLENIPRLGYKCIDWLDKDSLEEIEEFGLSDIAKKGLNWLNEDGIRELILKTTKGINYCQIIFKNYKCIKCGQIGDPRCLLPNCHFSNKPKKIHSGKDVFIHLNDKIYYKHGLIIPILKHKDNGFYTRYEHNGELIQETNNKTEYYHNGKLVTYHKGHPTQYHNGYKERYHTRNFIQYHSGKLVLVNFDEYGAVYSCCKAWKIVNVGDDYTLDDGTYNLDHVRYKFDWKLAEGCKAKWECCNDDNKYSQGCQERWSCCHQGALMGGNGGYGGCKEKCSNCGRSWQDEAKDGCSKRYDCCFGDVSSDGCQKRNIETNGDYKYTCCNNKKGSNGCVIKEYHLCCHSLKGTSNGCDNYYPCCNKFEFEDVYGGCIAYYKCCNSEISNNIYNNNNNNKNNNNKNNNNNNKNDANSILKDGCVIACCKIKRIKMNENNGCKEICINCNGNWNDVHTKGCGIGGNDYRHIIEKIQK